ncbi:DNA repair protein RadC [Oceanobacillus longus]|uniref:DNA repair protein RadC n=1 Tax=Oceanobacillus longus TaxID=930120 RepID=A0ABV8GRX6_9BACI
MIVVLRKKGEWELTLSTITIKDVPKEDRPRERLLKLGPAHLSNQEILAILIGSGTKDEPVMSVANRVLMHFDGLKLLREATIEELIAIKGIGTAKGLLILSAIELGKRMNEYKPNEKYVIKSPDDGADYIMEEMRNLTQEHFVVLFLNTKNQIIHRQTIFIGSLNASIVHPREVYREAVKRSAASIIVAHNHPSGDPAPSQEDIHVTRRLVESGKMIGIELLDHLIIGDRKFVSLKEKGYL